MTSKLKMLLKPQEMNVLYIGGRFNGLIDRVPYDTVTIEDHEIDHEAFQKELAETMVEFDAVHVRNVQAKHSKLMGTYHKKGMKRGFVLFVEEAWKGEENEYS